MHKESNIRPAEVRGPYPEGKLASYTVAEHATPENPGTGLRLDVRDITAPGLWLRLFHGRANPEISMQEYYADRGGWGLEGPCFPLHWFKGTYGDVSLCFVGGIGANEGEVYGLEMPVPITEQFLPVEPAGEFILYDGICYGEWELLACTGADITARGLQYTYWHPIYHNLPANDRQKEEELNRLFKCSGCGHTLPNSYCKRTEGYCYLCDPNIKVNELLEE